MCGIVGALSFQSSSFEITAPYLLRMRDTMIHRGPDGGGLWISPDRRVGFGHRRLSIIDLSNAADQPMANEDSSIWVTFNGEIYNHVEIRAELEQLGGHRWKTDHSDTEVILHAYEQWGIECLNRFRGMFAIALWDGRTRQLWLVRDRIGIKPLYYSVHHGRVAFASEIKALLQDPDQKRAVNEVSFYNYMSFLTTPGPDTLFEGIQKLAPGCWLRVSADGTTVRQRYWEVWDHTTPLVGVSEEYIAACLLDELRTAVRLRKVSDVPVGVFLSGGIDSSTNLALFSEGEKGKVKSFSIGYDRDYGSYPNELHHARRMSELVHSEHYERRLTQNDVIDFLPQMVRLQDEPLADPVCVPVYYLSKLARDSGVIVGQVGEGSDELFWGYRSWKILWNLQRYANLPLPNALKPLGLMALRASGKSESFQYELLRRAAAGLPVFWGGAEAFTEVQKRRLLSPRLARQFRTYTSWEALSPIRERFLNKAWEKSTLHWMSFLDLNLRLPELLLMRVDKMSMGVGLEARVPFLDHKFVELALSIPEAVKTKHGTLKYILKKSVAGIVPNDLIRRKKQGFGVPVYEWLFDRLGNFMRQELESFLERTDFVDRDAAMRLVDNKQRREAWVLLNFAMWWNHFIDQQSASAETYSDPLPQIAMGGR